MVRIGPVWDSTTATLAARGGLIWPIAIVAFFIPAVARDAVALALPPRSVAGALTGAALAFVTALAAIWGQLAVMAVAADPAPTGAGAARQAIARLLPVIGVILVITVAAILLVAPIGVAVAASGIDLRGMMATDGNPASMPSMTPGLGLFVAIWSLMLLVIGLWASARLLLTYAVVLEERRGLGAIGRSVALTRGSTWRLIGVLILFGIVLGIAVLAAQSVVGVTARLILGGEHVAEAVFAGGVAASAVATGFLALAYVFVARAYVFAREHEQVRG